MDAKQALSILDQASAAAHLNRAEHAQVIEAVMTLAAVINPQPAVDNKSVAKD